MSFEPSDLLAELERLEQDAIAPASYLVAYSGGLDSTVLLHALHESRQAHRRRLKAIHVDHGLHNDSPRWAGHCEALAREWGVEFTSVRVTVEAGRSGPEAAARDARYAALADAIEANDWLLSAHHEDDQAETLLLNLLRGSGPTGIAGIRSLRRFEGGWLARPLLGVPRSALHDYATRYRLRWVDDPSNDESVFDRNFLRNEVLPAVARRWPDAMERLGNSAGLARDAAGLLDELADLDLAAIATSGNGATRLSVQGLRALSEPRQKNAIRRAASLASLRVPGANATAAIVEHVLSARDDAQPLTQWPGAEARRFRDSLHLMPALAEFEWVPTPWDGRAALELGPGQGSLSLSAAVERGLPDAIVAAGLVVRTRQGGEEIRPEGQAHTRKLKKLLQEAEILPWMRERVPLVFAGDRLVAVGDVWHAEDALVTGGRRIVWSQPPSLR